MTITVFRRINALGTDTENEPLPLSDSDDTRSMNPLTLNAEKMIQIE